MSLENASIDIDATLTPSGGTTTAFESEGIINGKQTLFATADTDLRTRREIVCSVVKPKIQASAPNGYTQARSNVVIKVPLELDNGAITVQQLKIELAVDVEATTTEKETLLSMGAQVLNDSDFRSLFTQLSLQ
jgi:hypothetical protein